MTPEFGGTVSGISHSSHRGWEVTTAEDTDRLRPDWQSVSLGNFSPPLLRNGHSAESYGKYKSSIFLSILSNDAFIMSLIFP